jgi:hypothetical protein
MFLSRSTWVCGKGTKGLLISKFLFNFVPRLDWEGQA